MRNARAALQSIRFAGRRRERYRSKDILSGLAARSEFLTAWGSAHIG